MGHEVRRLLQGHAEVQAPGRDAADLSLPETLRGVVRDARPDVIVNAAAYTFVDRAESEPGLAHAVNAEAPRVLAEEAGRAGALLVHYSTDYVYDGTKRTPYQESDAANPLGEYGRSKLVGDEAIAATGVRHVILRTGWVYGLRGRNFLLTMLRLFAERDEVRVVNDQHGAPTSSSFVGEATVRAVQSGLDGRSSGVYHVAAAGQTTWFGFAEAIRAAQGSHTRVVPIATSEYPTPARRPAWSVLDCSRFARDAGVTPKSWSEQLVAVLHQL